MRRANRRSFLLALAGLAAIAMDARAANERVYRVGMLIPARREEIVDWLPWFHRNLAKLGYHEGRNLELVWQFQNRGDYAAEARALVAANPDVIMTEGTPATLALHRATRTIPIVTSVADPVAMGFAQSLAHPGGNITGVTGGYEESAGKQVELLQQLVPDLRRLAIFGRRENPLAHDLARPVERIARERRIEPEFFLMDTLEHLERDLKPRSGPGRRAAVFSSMTLDVPAAMALALRLRVPTAFADDEYVERGGLLSYALTHPDGDWHRLAQADRILRGVRPADMPFEVPIESFFSINLRTAKALGITVPAEVRLRANKVYE